VKKLARCDDLLDEKKAIAILALERCPDVLALAELFFEAAETERRLPGGIRSSVKACWPDAPDDWQAFGWRDVPFVPRPANRHEVDRYDLALQVTAFMPVADRRVVWAASHSAVRRDRGPAWSKIARAMGLHRDTVKRKFEHAILSLFYDLRDEA
jgi:hypothetical protein